MSRQAANVTCEDGAVKADPALAPQVSEEVMHGELCHAAMRAARRLFRHTDDDHVRGLGCERKEDQVNCGIGIAWRAIAIARSTPIGADAWRGCLLWLPEAWPRRVGERVNGFLRPLESDQDSSKRRDPQEEAA